MGRIAKYDLEAGPTSGAVDFDDPEGEEHRLGPQEDLDAMEQEDREFEAELRGVAHGR
jgi:hypothetical protein